MPLISFFSQGVLGGVIALGLTATAFFSVLISGDGVGVGVGFGESIGAGFEGSF